MQPPPLKLSPHDARPEPHSLDRIKILAAFRHCHLRSATPFLRPDAPTLIPAGCPSGRARMSAIGQQRRQLTARSGHWSHEVSDTYPTSQEACPQAGEDLQPFAKRGVE